VLQKLGLALPKYNTKAIRSGVFRSTVNLAGGEQFSSGEHSSKKAAEQEAAHIAMQGIERDGMQVRQNDGVSEATVTSPPIQSPSSRAPQRALSPRPEVIDLNVFARRVFDVCRELVRQPNARARFACPLPIFHINPYISDEKLHV
jgi:hypothetical protein